MVESDVFSIEMLMHQLKDKYDIEGVHEALVQRLYRYPPNETLFYIPELCNLYLCNPKAAMQKFLIDKGVKSLHFYLLVA